MKGERNRSSSLNHVMMRIIIFFISCYINILAESKENNGFSTDELIHINSPLSPFFNSNQIGSAILAHEKAFYLMKISYGKPPVELYQILDTGSDLSWIQCLPCTHCYNSTYAPFNPNNSCTFEFLTCPTPNTRCPYHIVYQDKSHSNGDLAKETITIGSGSQKREFKDFIFGCGHYNVGNFPHKGAGVVGFNRKEKSFITQFHKEHHGAFSYCMAPPRSTHAGRISFGHEALIFGNNVMTTPLILDSSYNIMLTGISVGNRTLKYFPDSYSSSNDSKGSNFQLKLVIDTGCNAIYLSNSFYSDVEKTIIKYIQGKTPVCGVSGYNLCYTSSLTDAEIPKIKLHFPGVILEMSPHNIFADGAKYRCLAMFPSNNIRVLGNMAQINFLIGFDLVEKKLSFKPTNCAVL